MKKIVPLFFIYLCCLFTGTSSALAQTKQELFLKAASVINTYSWVNQYITCKDGSGADYVKRIQMVVDTVLMDITMRVETSFIDGTSSYFESQNNLKNIISADVCEKCLSCGTDFPIKLGFKKGTMKILKLEGTAAVPENMFLFLRWDAEPDLKDKMLLLLKQLSKN